MDWIKRLLADVDGHPDEARFAMLIGCLAVIGFEAWNMYLNRPFNPTEFATGYGVVVGAFGAALWARGKN